MRKKTNTSMYLRDRPGVLGIAAVLVQMAVFTFGKGHSADELATLSKRIMLSAIHALPEIFVKLRDQIHAGSNPLLMCTMYYICYDHGLPRSEWLEQGQPGC